MKEYSNNIFQVITHIDKKDYNYFKTLPESDLKEMQPYTLMKWLSHTNTNNNVEEYYTLVVNELVNKNFWELSKYKDLQLQLLCASGCGKWTKHSWLKTKTKSKKDKKVDELRKFFSFLTDDEFELKMKSLSKTDIDELYHNIGISE